MYTIESQRRHQGENLFKLADLNDLMTMRQTQLGSTPSKLHASGLKKSFLVAYHDYMHITKVDKND